MHIYIYMYMSNAVLIEVSALHKLSLRRNVQVESDVHAELASHSCKLAFVRSSEMRPIQLMGLSIWAQMGQ